jgi:hypothetical protein
MVKTEAQTLPHRTSYGPFERIVEPGRHVYRATMDYRRWMIGGFCVVVSAALAWASAIMYADKHLEGAFRFAIIVMPAFFAVVFALIALIVFVMILRLTITPRVATLFCVQPIQRRFGTRTFELQDLLGVDVRPFPVFSRGGNTEAYSAILRFSGGGVLNPHVSFDDRRSAARFAGDLTESIRLMGGTAEVLVSA